MRGLCSSEILHSVKWQFLTDVLGQPIISIFKGKEIQKREENMTEVTLCNLLFLGLCHYLIF
jgi:hypothetical protein